MQPEPAKRRTEEAWKTRKESEVKVGCKVVQQKVDEKETRLPTTCKRSNEQEGFGYKENMSNPKLVER